MGVACFDNSQKNRLDIKNKNSYNPNYKSTIKKDNFSKIKSIEEESNYIINENKIIQKRHSNKKREIKKNVRNKDKDYQKNNSKSNYNNNNIKDKNEKEKNINKRPSNENMNNYSNINQKKENNKNGKSYENLSKDNNYYLICPDCGLKTPSIQNIIYEDTKDDFIIKYNCECNNLQNNIKSAVLFNFISNVRPSNQNNDILSKENREKMIKILNEKKNKFKGFEIVKKLIDSFPLDKSVAPLPNIFKSNSKIKQSNVKESDIHIEYSQNYIHSMLPEIKEEKDIFRSYKCTKTLTGHNGRISSLIQLQSGSIAAGDYDKKIMIWDLEKSIKLKEIKENGIPLCLLEFDPNFLLSGNSQKEINLWDISLDKIEKIFNFSGHDLWVNCLVKCNIQFFASASNDKTIWIWDYYKKHEVRNIVAHEEGILSLILLKNGNLCSGSHLLIKVWNWQNGECIYTMFGHLEWVKCLCELEDEILVSGSEDYTIKVWKNYNEIKTLTDHQNQVRALCKIDDHYFASGSFDNTIKIWDIENWKCFDTLIGHTSNVTCIIKIKENTLVSCSCDKTIIVWEQINNN